MLGMVKKLKFDMDIPLLADLLLALLLPPPPPAAGKMSPPASPPKSWFDLQKSGGRPQTALIAPQEIWHVGLLALMSQ